MERIVVTGGSGFIGSNMVASLGARGHPLLNLDSVGPRNPDQASLWRPTDITDAPAIAEAIDDFRPDAIIHLAARTDLSGSSIEDYAANTIGSQVIVDAVMARPGIRRLLFGSSMLVCRLGHIARTTSDYCPNTAYGESKVRAEKIARAADPSGQRIVIFRPTSIWGPWFGQPYRNFFDIVLAGYYVHPSGAATRRSYGYVDNAVAQLDALLAAPPERLGDELYHLADYAPVDIGVWADLIAAAAGRRRPLRVPLPVMQMAALAGDGLQALGWKQPPMTNFRLSNMLMDAVQETGPIAALCPVLPVSLAKGVTRTIDWLKREAP